MAAPPEEGVLWARGLHYAYGGSPALQGVSVRVREGEILSVTGPRGSGKTTLLSCLSGHLAPHDGEIWFDDVPVHSLRRSSREKLRRDRFGWIGSEPHLVPELTAWENAALPLLMAGVGHREARAAAHEWLERLDVVACARMRPAALLQSQRQRVSIARALVHSPAVVFADEPTAPLHAAERAQVLRILTSAARSHGMTMVLATHDPAVTATVRTSAHVLVDRTLHLVDGRQDSADGGADDDPGGGDEDDGGTWGLAGRQDDDGPRSGHGPSGHGPQSGPEDEGDGDGDREDAPEDDGHEVGEDDESAPAPAPAQAQGSPTAEAAEAAETAGPSDSSGTAEESKESKGSEGSKDAKGRASCSLSA